MTLSTNPVVDVAFPILPVRGTAAPLTVPADHGYALFSALSRVLP